MSRSSPARSSHGDDGDWENYFYNFKSFLDYLSARQVQVMRSYWTLMRDSLPDKLDDFDVMTMLIEIKNAFSTGSKTYMLADEIG